MAPDSHYFASSIIPAAYLPLDLRNSSRGCEYHGIQIFFSYTIGLLIIGVITLWYKVAFMTKCVASADADLGTGRRELSEETIAQLREYHGFSYM